MPQKAHLLIVDDEANTLASLSRAFRLAGHEATVCDNAAKALDLARSQAFDLIISDVVMPGRDGLSLLEELKSQGVVTPVVMMSGQAHIDMAVRATSIDTKSSRPGRVRSTFSKSRSRPTNFCSRLRMHSSYSGSNLKTGNSASAWENTRSCGLARR